MEDGDIVRWKAKKKRKKKREKEEKRKLNPGGEFADRVRDERCVKNEPMKRLLYSISRERETVDPLAVAC